MYGDVVTWTGVGGRAGVALAAPATVSAEILSAVSHRPGPGPHSRPTTAPAAPDYQFTLVRGSAAESAARDQHRHRAACELGRATDCAGASAARPATNLGLVVLGHEFKIDIMGAPQPQPQHSPCRQGSQRWSAVL